MAGDEGRGPVEHRGEHGHWTQDVNNQHAADAIAVVDHLMQMRVVKQDCLAQFPCVRLMVDDDAGGIVFRHAEGQMVTEIAEVRSFVSRDRLARIEDREERLNDVGRRYDLAVADVDGTLAELRAVPGVDLSDNLRLDLSDRKIDLSDN